MQLALLPFPHPLAVQVERDGGETEERMRLELMVEGWKEGSSWDV